MFGSRPPCSCCSACNRPGNGTVQAFSTITSADSLAQTGRKSGRRRRTPALRRCSTGPSQNRSRRAGRLRLGTGLAATAPEQQGVAAGPAGLWAAKRAQPLGKGQGPAQVGKWTVRETKLRGSLSLAQWQARGEAREAKLEGSLSLARWQARGEVQMGRERGWEREARSHRRGLPRGAPPGKGVAQQPGRPRWQGFQGEGPCHLRGSSLPR